ncbi:tetratricopeptide repeat protein [Caulobacter sp.]|uniref:tetratricopeptide repeat protein n=1 Tax=Caulobacter sp. TaxID=78 RepID=UPI001B2F397E|nr:tetratricopeptide repeat protein [Caulobacter sp.]MBO9543048.1 hypothetical protein [Caulobacter sp.]
MRLIALLFAASLATASLPAPPAAAQIAQIQLSAQEAADQAVVRKAQQAGSFTAMAPMEKDLIAVLDHAPAHYPQIERVGDVTNIRFTGASGPGAGALAGAIQAKGETFAVGMNTYAVAAMMLGSLANERRDPRKAIAYLDRGLALQPGNLVLLAERGMAMVVLRQFSDALALYEKAEKLDFVTKGLNRGAEGRLLRGKGFVLIELKRLDEAEAAYVAALKLEPDHPTAKAELDYIRKQRGGAPQTEIELKNVPPPPAKP